VHCREGVDAPWKMPLCQDMEKGAPRGESKSGVCGNRRQEVLNIVVNMNGVFNMSKIW